MIARAARSVRLACLVLVLGAAALVVVLWAASVGGWPRFAVALVICAVGFAALSRPAL